MQGLFDFSEYFLDKDGDKVKVNYLSDTIKEIESFLKCSKAKAVEVLAELKKEYDVYSNNNQIILIQNNKVVYNFEMFGMTFYCGHKYNDCNEWDFRNFVEGKKTKIEKKQTSRRLPKITVTATEKQIKKAQQLYYAKSIGLDITYKDYQRFYLA